MLGFQDSILILKKKDRHFEDHRFRNDDIGVRKHNLETGNI
jgi:hypothetical protein